LFIYVSYRQCPAFLLKLQKYLFTLLILLLLNSWFINQEFFGVMEQKFIINKGAAAVFLAGLFYILEDQGNFPGKLFIQGFFQ